MAEVIGVKFRCASKLYYFDPAGEEFVCGDRVVVETARGIELGRVVGTNKEISDEETAAPLKPIIRKATEEDLASEAINKAKEPEAFRICKEKIRAHGLDMKLVTVEYTFDGSKVLFYFTADGRVDFRELVKDLASTFRTRIELRQIGVRDEAKIKGGIGICGRPLCCSTYLCDFVPVSIRMAKEQNLSLNPTKISGCCGRLMCCLKNEEETYEVLNSQLPSVGDAVTIKGDRLRGTVQSVNVLRQKVRVLVSSKDGDTEAVDYDVDQLQFEKGRRTFSEVEEPEELLELEEMDARDAAESMEDSNQRRDGQGNEKRDRGTAKRPYRPRNAGEETEEAQEHHSGKEHGRRQHRHHKKGRDQEQVSGIDEETAVHREEAEHHSLKNDKSRHSRPRRQHEGEAAKNGAAAEAEERRRFRPRNHKRKNNHIHESGASGKNDGGNE